MPGFLLRLRDPLYTNSFYLMFANIVGSLLGFIFWMLAAKLFLPEDVGVATALLSALVITIALSRLGIDKSLIRYLPERDSAKVINTTAIFTTIVAIIIGILFIIFVDYIVPELSIIRQYAIVFVVFLISGSLGSAYTTGFISLRKAKLVLVKNIMGGSRVLFLIPFGMLGALGIFLSEFIASLVMMIYSIFMLHRLGVRPSLQIDRRFLKDSSKFSGVNYIMSFVSTIPVHIISIMILAILGPSPTAIFYISFMIFQSLLIIPNSTSLSFFVEGSYGARARVAFRKTLFFSSFLLVPLIILIYLMGEMFLAFIGEDYSEDGFELLKILVFSSFFVMIVEACTSFLRITRSNRAILIMGVGILLLLLTSSYVSLLQFGLIGIGYSWILTYGVMTIIGLLLVREAQEMS